VRTATDELIRGGNPATRHVQLLTALGWGVEVDEAAAARHPYEPEPQLHTVLVLPDGSVGDR
jgi:L-alanine-DL-glutamate epimerase-like enolase superfamily enzyme